MIAHIIIGIFLVLNRDSMTEMVFNVLFWSNILVFVGWTIGMISQWITYLRS